MAFKQHNLVDIVKMSPTLRNIGYLTKICRTVMNNLWFEISYAHMGVRSVDLWKEDKAFLKYFKDSQGRTQLNPVKLYTLFQFAKNVVHLEGDVAELGVYRGGSAKLLAKVFNKHSKSKKIHLFDTFEGMPKSDFKDDIFKKGDLADTSFDDVKSYMKNCKNTELHKGLFTNTLHKVEDRKFCFVHIDADYYSSVTECCNFFYPRMTPGGIMIFDDYGFVCAPGGKRAVDEFFKDKTEKPVWLSTGQCMVTIQIS